MEESAVGEEAEAAPTDTGEAAEVSSPPGAPALHMAGLLRLSEPVDITWRQGGLGMSHEMFVDRLVNCGLQGFTGPAFEDDAPARILSITGEPLEGDNPLDLSRYLQQGEKLRVYDRSQHSLEFGAWPGPEWTNFTQGYGRRFARPVWLAPPPCGHRDWCRRRWLGPREGDASWCGS